uniref:Uncharacterized protein KIAA1751 homolog n=1 Tax=Phallusia mammillata TaxID=59560 RepID=A0A6F9D8L5_9ASCI|nr:uncharacterized protein KIAA1751 homolog [Phallusia mammillata]
MDDMLEPIGMPSNQQWESDSDDEEGDYDHQYDDFEDLFSNETDSIGSRDQDDNQIGMYLETDPALQKEVAQLIMLKRHLDSLQQKLHEKEFGVLKAREELDACRVRLRALEEEVENVEKNITLTKAKDNMASYHRLVSKRDKLQTEIEADRKLEVDIQAHLQEAELSHSRVEIEQRHYAHLAEKVIEKEDKVAQHKDKMARYRMNKEHHIARTAALRHNKAVNDLQKTIEEKQQRQQHIIESAIENHEKAKVFLKQSLSKVRQQETRLDKSQQVYMKRRMDTIVGLKSSIASNRENLRALQARDAAFDKKDKAAEKLERHQVLNEGGNPEQVLLRRKKLNQFEKEKQDFEARQKVNKARIVSSILNEETSISKRKKQQPQLWTDKHREKAKQLGPPPKPSIHSKIELTEKDEPVFLQQVKYMKQTPREDIQREVLSEASSSDVVAPHPRSSSDQRVTPQAPVEQEETLAQPEFQGLWEQKHKVYKVPKEDVTVKPVGGTKMEQEILNKTLNKHRDGIIVKQVAAGREFKGQPFYSKPDVIHFKDLDVGRTYKKKIVITNVSYSINFLKLTGLSEHLKDFIKIDFNPPGQMSAGMSCDMTVTFKPMINEDLIGEVRFMAQTGPFTISLKCTTKKCDLSVDVTSIDFGSQVVGETIRRSVTLVNKGALGTRFDFQKVPDKPATTYTLETSLGRLTTAETPGITDDSDAMKGTPNPETGARSKRPIISEGMPQTADRSFKISEYPDASEQDYEERTEFVQQHYARGEGDEITFATPATEYQTMAEELKVGEVMSGEIEPFSSVRLDIVFAPCIPGDIQATFRISFTDPESAPLEIKASAVAIHVPVWLERQNIDLKICMYDRLYQDQIIVHNRASTALRLNFEVPRELRSHLELLPKTGYIQAKSTFTAQLKFLPRQNLAEDASGLFDPETGILEAPLVIRVADQTRPVEFVVNAVVTSSDLEFDRTDIDFGHCGIYESVVSTVKLTNHSILPQLFGFVNIPEFVDVQPNDGFGTILPLETIEIDLIVEAKRARHYDFTLTCRSGINRDFPLHCKAVGVHPPLDLSHQVVHFAATALDDVSTALIHVINAHTSANEFTHPVPRIGKGDIVPVGPTSFEFVLPGDSPISVTPCVGTVNPGEKCHVTLEFAPKLSDSDVRKEAVHVMQEQREEKVREEQERLRKEQQEMVARQQEEEKAAKGKKTPKTPAKPKTGDSTSKSAKSSAKSSEKLDQPLPTPEMIDENSTAYKAARASLTRSYPGHFRSFTIPCYVATGSCSDNVDPSSLQFNDANTLFLEVHCPAIKPPVVIISNHGHSLTDFGQVSIGQNTIKPISIQNISDHSVELTLSVLDTNGPFQVLNALRILKPDETHTLLVSFTPTAGKVFYEVLKIVSPSSELDVCLTGRGVTPVVHLSPEGGALDLGHVLQGETSEATFTLENKSSLAVKYSIRMDSASLLKHDNQQQLPEFVRRDGKPAKALVGPQNNNGSCVFDCVPCEGEIKTGETHEIEVTFNPDHESRHFSDGARVILFNTEEAHAIHVTGQGHEHMMFVTGNDPLDVAVESLASNGKVVQESADALAPVQNILLSFTSHVSDEGFTQSTRTLNVGCLKSNAFAGRKNGEWIVDNVQPAQGKGFVAEPLKASVDVDSTKELTFTWNPPENHDPSVPVETAVLLTLKGDVTLTYNVILTGLISFK